MTNYTIKINEQFNSKEIYFTGKPSEAERAALKGLKFRWNGKKLCWYGFADDETIRAALAGKNDDKGNSSNRTSKKQPAPVYDLFEMTRTDAIPNNYELYRLRDGVEIAAIIRKHLRDRFPFCKWSIRSSYNEIFVYLKAAPFGKESEEVKAITEYAYKFMDSYNYDNSDPYTDYFDVNFYGIYSAKSIIDYDYTKTETTEAAAAISALFAEKKAAADAEEEERRQRDYDEYIKQHEKEAEESKKQAEIDAASRAIIEAEHIETPADFYALAALAPKLNKCCSLDDIAETMEEFGTYREDCHITKAVYFTEKVYNLFINLLLDDFSFLAGMGGTTTDDSRIKSMYDFQMMSKEERETVKFYCNSCVAIYSDNVLKLIIDPQGFSYARYTFIVDDQTTIKENYTPEQLITEEEAAENEAAAETLADISAEIITNNDLVDTWNKSDFEKYKNLLKSYITEHNTRFDLETIRAVDLEEIKKPLYDVYFDYYGTAEQFNRAALKAGQKITVAYISSFATLSLSQITFDSFTQTGKLSKLIFKQKNGRKLYYNYIPDKVLIFDGWQDIPETLLYEVEQRSGITIKRSKYFCHDSQQLDDIKNYLETLGIEPIIDTYSPKKLLA